VQAPLSTKEDVESFVRDLISKKSLLIQKIKVKADKVAQKVAQKVATAVEQKRFKAI
jgi:Fe2+ transport system protein B